MKEAELLEFDRQHIWHPYSTMCNPPPVFPVKSASGTHLVLEDDTRLIDGMASWWCVIHGYNHPRLNAALQSQLNNMAHVMFGGLTHAPAVALAEKLINISPSGLDRVFFADSGSVAVEVAIKMAIQYQAARGRQNKQKLLTIRGGYHGDTLGAMAVCDPVTGMHTLFNNVLPQHFFAERPVIAYGDSWNDSDIDSLRQLLQQHQEEIAAIILEPVVQGAGGMWFYAPEYLAACRELCNEYDVLLICDEIATGFGRAGKLFASEYAGITPDILCLGKALTGGYMTLAATLATENVAETISADGVFMHGPTFMANPLACAVALESIRLLEDNHWQDQVETIEQSLQQGLAACSELDQVSDVRVLGAIGVVELHEGIDMHKAPQQFVDRGVWVRPFGKLVYVMPPYIISPEELECLTTAMFEVVQLQ